MSELTTAVIEGGESHLDRAQQVVTDVILPTILVFGILANILNLLILTRPQMKVCCEIESAEWCYNKYKDLILSNDKNEDLESSRNCLIWISPKIKKGLKESYTYTWKGHSQILFEALFKQVLYINAKTWACW